MTNPTHLALIKKGTHSINKWRIKHPHEILDVSGVALNYPFLKDANLSPINLVNSQLHFLNLSGANLAKSDLQNVNILSSFAADADFSNSNLSNSSLAGLNYHNINLSNANLSNSKILYCTLIKTNFKGANLTGSECFETNFSDSDFTNANLAKSDISYCYFKFGSLSGTKFSNTKLNGCLFEAISLCKSIITNTEIGYTKFINCDLSECDGLGRIKHKDPSNIDILTIQRSLANSNFCLKPDFKKFLLSAGYPIELINELPKILGEVKYYSAFVCYGEPDKKFAKKLRNDLVKNGVTCWLYSLDYTPGEKTWREVSEKRRGSEKMIVICSCEALIRDGVKKEIEEQIDEDPDKIIPISLDSIWKEEGFQIKRGNRDLKPFLIERNYADFSDEAKYDDSLKKLLKGLERNPEKN